MCIRDSTHTHTHTHTQMYMKCVFLSLVVCYVAWTEEQKQHIMTRFQNKVCLKWHTYAFHKSFILSPLWPFPIISNSSNTAVPAYRFWTYFTHISVSCEKEAEANILRYDYHWPFGLARVCCWLCRVQNRQSTFDYDLVIVFRSDLEDLWKRDVK